MKVKKWKLASFLLPCLLLFALIYLAPMCMVFGSSFFEWKAGGVFKSMLSGTTHECLQH